MKNRKTVVMLIILILLLLLGMNKSLAESKIKIIADNEVIKQGEETKIRIELNNTNVAAFTLEIFWDNTKLEYISGPENSNYSNNRIIYTKVNDKGVSEDTIDVDGFVFKGNKDGIANVVVTGDFYTSSGETVDLDIASLQIQIGEVKAIDEQVTDEIKPKEKNVSDDNTNLSILRLNREGISPEFNKDVKEYYFIVDESITNLEVTAIPKNADSTVTVTGNTDFKIGKNVISIKVQSKDNTKMSEYKIYVTRTYNLDNANANLETLAIRQGTLSPEFDANVTNYKTEIANDVNRLELLAIPQKENAKVNILGNDEMKIGSNKIEIVVTAGDGITSKKYEIDVYRRNESEETQNKENQIEAERISTSLQEQYSKNNIVEENSITEETNKRNITLIGISIIAVVCIAVIGYVIYRKR